MQSLQRHVLRRLYRFSRQSSTFSRSSRPFVPFLSTPSARPQYRYFTTEKKKWLKAEAYLVARYMTGIWGIAFCGYVIYWSISHELAERDHPTPHEWSYISRMRSRIARVETHQMERPTDWVKIMELSLGVLKRLEDKAVDGAGLEDLVEGSIFIEGVGRVGYDITSKSENWSRGYYETLMMTAKAAEHLDGWVVDKTRKIVFPPEVVLGPSNPDPKPIPAGASSAPQEENCDLAYEPAENYYLRILTTKGFTQKQKMDAALAYAAFLDFKQLPEAAIRMHTWALSLATENLPPSPPPYDPHTYTLNEKAGPPSSNLLDALTALATHKARNDQVSDALNIFASILKARKSLSSSPPPSGPLPRDKRYTTQFEKLLEFVQPPAYPPPPSDGTLPPWRSTRERCEEAALGVYIGEIFFAGKSRDEGLSWTREAVDTAEEQLRNEISETRSDPQALSTCRECLRSGLTNWMTMASRLAREEEAKRVEDERKARDAPAYAFWRSRGDSGSGGNAEGRWAAESKVVEERKRRTRDIAEDLTPPSAGLLSFFQV